MRTCRTFIFLFVTLCTSILVAQENESQDLSSSASGKPLTLEDILANEKPVGLYIQSYGAFQFSSKSRIVTSNEKTGKTYEGRTFFERDQIGNYHLVRVPLTGEPAIELYYIQGKVFLRQGPEEAFRVVRHQIEFDRWAERSVREVLVLFKENSFSEAKVTASDVKFTCRQKDSMHLCMDPETGLPLKGTFRRPQAGGSALDMPLPEVQFSMAPSTHQEFKILPPESNKAGKTSKTLDSNKSKDE